jgi:hypothetical protein
LSGTSFNPFYQNLISDLHEVADLNDQYDAKNAPILNFFKVCKYKCTPIANKGENTPQPVFTLTYKYTLHKQTDNF